MDRVAWFQDYLLANLSNFYFFPDPPCVPSSGHLHSCSGVGVNPDWHPPQLQTFSPGYGCSSLLEAYPCEGRAQFVLPFGLAASNLSILCVCVVRSHPHLFLFGEVVALLASPCDSLWIYRRSVLDFFRVGSLPSQARTRRFHRLFLLVRFLIWSSERSRSFYSARSGF